VSTERPSALTCYKASVIQGLPEWGGTEPAWAASARFRSIVEPATAVSTSVCWRVFVGSHHGRRDFWSTWRALSGWLNASFTSLVVAPGQAASGNLPGAPVTAALAGNLSTRTWAPGRLINPLPLFNEPARVAGFYFSHCRNFKHPSVRSSIRFSRPSSPYEKRSETAWKWPFGGEGG